MVLRTISKLINACSTWMRAMLPRSFFFSLLYHIQFRWNYSYIHMNNFCNWNRTFVYIVPVSFALLNTYTNTHNNIRILCSLSYIDILHKTKLICVYTNNYKHSSTRNHNIKQTNTKNEENSTKKEIILCDLFTFFFPMVYCILYKIQHFSLIFIFSFNL